LGRHSKPSRIRIQRLLPVAAAPALAGVAAAFCLAPQALADPVAGPPPTSHTATLDASPLGPSVQLLTAIQGIAPQKKAAASQPASYTVKSGDTLSAIAQREYHNQAAWPVLYYANHNKIRWASEITPGEVLQVPAKPAKIPSPPGQLAPAAPAPAVTAAPVAQAETSSVTPAAQSVSRPTSTSTYTGGTPGGSFGSCVVAAESGGNSQVMNSSGHYGLYQFSESTWEEYGGSAADFGDASASEQNQVFANALAAGGQSNWSAYDGC
jgi:LysM repeat protein